MMRTKTIVQNYLDYLQQGNMEELLKLFASNALIDSPIYGVKSATDFYRQLQGDTQNSELELLGIFEEEDSDKLALYFTYKWTIKNGEIVSFDVVDIFEFNGDQKISTLKIIYDTAIARTLVDQMKN